MAETGRRLPLTVAAVPLLVLLIFFAYVTFPRDSTHIQDFGAFVGSVEARHLGLNPYGIYQVLPERPDIRSNSPNANPPLSLLVFEPLSTVDPLVARYSWYVISILLYGLTLWLLQRTYPQHATPLRLLWGAAILPFWFSLHLGQIYVLMALAVVGGWLLLQSGRLILAGVLIGLLVSIKPQFAVWPVLLILTGRWSIALTAAATAVPLSSLPLFVFGPGIYAQWLAALNTQGASFDHVNNFSLIGVTSLVGMPVVGVVSATMLLLGLATWARRTCPPVLQTTRVAIIAALLASPLAWLGYTLALLPMFFERRWSFPLRLLALIVLVPVPLGPGYTLALLAILGWVLRPSLLDAPLQPQLVTKSA